MQTARYRAVPPKSTIAVDFSHRRSIEGEKGKKKKRKRRKKKTRRRIIPRVVLAYMPSPPAGRPRAIAAHRQFFSRTGRKIEAMSPK
ncbi:hypothetical protein GW17_00035620 [Ensete ventricosum]|nr:hypothetical protein GW17_00035620 [Ensete ventricosum]